MVPLFQIPSLKQLKFWANNCTGENPRFDENMPNLTLLQAGNNQLSGAMPQFQLSRLDTLSISQCSISSVPDLTTTCPNLQTIGVLSNKANLVVNQNMCATFGAGSFTVTSGYTKTCA
ncbi:hypothetical protein CTEN210_12731 [Chaetoceros tenuissimus]|uniref:Uncharacterized protein n=1 Tax=Chaetoceros tenuissimus TaxID=426638 RepID=A0AAD3HAC9_9STRA|nr:hypothetical protein CTEN210_12731 [Chaetoceros tenuissimus]